jgi:hypothetical protein
MAAKIENIRLIEDTDTGRFELRFDWDNDCHQSVVIQAPYTAADVSTSLYDAIWLIARDENDGVLW